MPSLVLPYGNIKTQIETNEEGEPHLSEEKYGKGGDDF